jgi:hypothetical protein
VAIRVNGDPLIPDVAGMTRALSDRLRASALKTPFERLEAILDEDGRFDPNLEHMLSAVRRLRDVAGPSTVRGLSIDDLDGLDQTLSDGVAELAGPSLPNDATPYHDVMRWVGGTERERPVEVFTPNYDLLVEQALEDLQVPYFDGFVGARHPFFDLRAIEDDSLPRRWARV